MTCLIDISDFDEILFKKVKNTENIISLSEKNRKAKNHSYVGRVILGYMLKKFFGIKTYRCLYNENGKPYILNENVFFNISHSKNYVLCSVEKSEVGCDIQTLSACNDKVAKRHFTLNENSVLNSSEHKDKIFTKLWTMKESILKKEGAGLSGGLSTYDFGFFAKEDFFELYKNKFSCFDLKDAYICVCSENFCEKIEIVSKAEFENYIDSILK